MSLPSRRIWPDVGRSNPAISLRVVVLPHPDGPSREKNSPGSTVRSMPATASVSPNDFVSPASRTSPPCPVLAMPRPRDRVAYAAYRRLRCPERRRERADVLHEQVDVPL